MVKNALILESGESHTELFYSHILILKKGNYKVFMYIRDILMDRVPAVSDVEISSFSSDLTSKQILQDLLSFIKKNNIELVILNTAHGSLCKQLAIRLLWNRNVKIVGVYHYINKLKWSFSQKILSLKIKKQFILNSLFLENKTIKHSKNRTTFYPIFYPKIEERVEKNKNELFITIPGGISQKHRDYFGFTEILKQKKNLLPKNIKFVLLGHTLLPDGQKMKQIIQEEGWEERFVIFDDFVDNQTFLKYINSTDLLLPLIPTDQPEYRAYLSQKISGSFNLSLGFHIPLLIYQDFEPFEDFKDTCFFYRDPTLFDMLLELANHPERIQEKKAIYAHKQKFTFDYQAENYLRFIESVIN